MSHLGDSLSALIDGELGGLELDRANAHLAACETCRGEAAALRQLKRELRALGALGSSDELARRVLAITRADYPPAITRRRGRYLMWSAVSIIALGVGAAAFTLGGGASGGLPGPKVTPPLDMYAVEHADLTGDVPYPAMTNLVPTGKPSPTLRVP